MNTEEDKTTSSGKQLENRVKLEQEMERESLLMQANAVKEETLDFGTDGKLEFKNELADMLIEEIDDPDVKYLKYYNVLNRLLKKHLPKGKEFAEHRELIYEEKNTFLTRGHRKGPDGIRHHDGRMAYNSDIAEVIEVVTDWITANGSMWNLYIRLRDLNKSKGYPLE